MSLIKKFEDIKKLMKLILLYYNIFYHFHFSKNCVMVAESGQYQGLWIYLLREHNFLAFITVTHYIKMKVLIVRYREYDLR